MLVRERREGNRREATRLEPVHCRRIDGDSFLSRDIRTILQVVVLSLLLSLQKKRFLDRAFVCGNYLEVQARKTTKILLAHSLVDSGTATNALTVVVC